MAQYKEKLSEIHQIELSHLMDKFLVKYFNLFEEFCEEEKISQEIILNFVISIPASLIITSFVKIFRTTNVSSESIIHILDDTILKVRRQLIEICEEKVSKK